MSSPALLETGESCESPAPTSQKVPERWWIIVSDWCNLLAGITLVVAFVIGGLIFDQDSKSLSALPGGSLQFFFCIEGVFWAIGLFFMIPIMAVSGNAFATMQFAVLFAGGLFFSFSGLVVPACIKTMGDAISHDPCKIAGGSPKIWNAFAHFGITCFMIGTAMGQSKAMAAPKNKFISFFWGSTMYLLGAWIIGIFKFWGPILFGFTAATWNWWAAVAGAVCLTIAPVIFGLMNGSFGIKCGA